MFKVVLDTNIYISATFWNGSPYKIIEKALDKKFQVFVTLEILKEYEKIEV